MTAWLAQINPTVVISLLVAGGGWLWNTIRGEKTDSIAATIRGLADQAVEHALMDATGILDGIDVTNATAKIDAWVWAELAKKGIAKNDTIDLLVQPLVADAVARVLSGLRERMQSTNDNLDKINTTAAGMDKAIADAKAEGLARVKDMASMVEVVPFDEAVTPVVPTVLVDIDKTPVPQ